VAPKLLTDGEGAVAIPNAEAAGVAPKVLTDGEGAVAILNTEDDDSKGNPDGAVPNKPPPRGRLGGRLGYIEGV
jgi:hypothetical protein